MEIGEERTKHDQEKIKESMNSVLSLRMDGKDEIDIYDFDGENFRNKEVISTFINLPSRTKKRATLSEKKERVMKVYCPYQDFQLYNIPALQEILEKENHLEQTKRVLKRV